MERIKKWLNEHKSLIIGLLIILLMFKNCNSCQQERIFEYKEAEYAVVIDSLYKCIDNLNDDVDSLNNIIELQSKDIEHLNNSNETYSITYKNLTESNRNLQNTNKVLVITNRDLTKKDTIN